MQTKRDRELCVANYLKVIFISIYFIFPLHAVGEKSAEEENRQMEINKNVIITFELESNWGVALPLF